MTATTAPGDLPSGAVTLAPVDRKAEILDAAAGLFARRGFRDVGMDDIADALGVSGPALYWHFAGKDEILTAVLAAASDDFADAFASLADGPDVTPHDYAALVVDRYLAAPGRSGTLVREGHRAIGVAAERGARLLEEGRRSGGRLLAGLPFALAPELARMRLRAVVGPLMTLTLDPPSLPSRRVRELATAGTAALLAVPPVAPRPTEPRPAWRPPRSRREEILAAARELFEQRGYHAVTVDDIGEALGMRGPSIYRHFASKRELVAAAWDREATRFVAGTLDALRDARSAADALARLAASVAEVARENHGLMRMTYLDLDDRPEYVGTWSTWRPFVVDAWCDVLAEARTDLAGAEVRFVVDMTLSTLVQACVHMQGRPEWVGEIANLGLAFVTAVPS